MSSFIIPGADKITPGLTKSTKFSDSAIRLGIVFEEIPPGNDGETLYTVMCTINGQDVPITCSRMSRAGGVNSYEEYNYRGYRDSMGVGNNTGFDKRAGDVVVVAMLDGNARRGIILGGIRHPARTETLTANGKTAYKRRTNGIEEEITEDGEYKITNKGILAGSNLQMDTPPTGLPMIAEQDDPIKGGSTFGFDIDGNFNISDGDKQSIIVKRDSTIGGQLEITSGTTTIVLAGGTSNQEVTVTTKGPVTVTTDQNIELQGLGFNLTTKDAIAIESKTGISITAKGSELLDLITQLIDEMGNLTINSPQGPCAPFNGAPTWSKIMALQQKIKLMMG